MSAGTFPNDFRISDFAFIGSGARPKKGISSVTGPLGAQIARRTRCSLLKRTTCSQRLLAPGSLFRWLPPFISCFVQGAPRTRITRCRGNRSKSFQNRQAPELKSTAATSVMPQQRSKSKARQTDAFGKTRLSRPIPRPGTYK